MFFFVSQMFLAKPEISIEEHRAKTYLRRRKEWEDRKAREAIEVCKTEDNQAKVNETKLIKTRASIADCKVQPQASIVDQNYEVNFLKYVLLALAYNLLSVAPVLKYERTGIEIKYHIMRTSS